MKDTRRVKKGRARKIVKWVFLGILLLAAAAIAVIAARLYPVYREYSANANTILMEMNEGTFRRAGNTYVYDRDDELIGELGNEKYEYVPLSEVSEYVVSGYIAREDKRFLEHGGVDLKATLRAAVRLVQNRGEITQGGSTITQQVVKNNFLTQEQTYERKILEMILAVRLEREYSKSDIMEFYVNSCYYGENCYGIEGASEYYFGVPAKDLTLAEAAMLVVTSNSPSARNPVADYDYVLAEKDGVIDEMLGEGYVTQEQADEAKLEAPEVVRYTLNVDSENYMITYALHCAALEMMKESGFEFEYVFDTSEGYEEYRSAYSELYSETLGGIRSGGYRIYTSFDTGVQDALQEAVDANLSGFYETDEDGSYRMQGAAVCIDNSTGMVVAVVGGREGLGSYNRGYQAARQPGSAIKPLLDYAPAVNEGIIWPDTVYDDSRFDDEGYSPENSGGVYYGSVTAREALVRSLNTVALRVFIDVGKDAALSYLGAMRFSTLAYADSTMDGISIGGFTNGVTVADMAKGYSALARGGSYTDATCLRSVVSESGETLYDAAEDASEEQVFLPDTAFIVTDMMEGVFRDGAGTAHSRDTDAQFYAGKTGTTNDGKDAWFCGYSAYYTAAVWVGADMPEPVEGLSGSTYPLSIWADFMETVHEGLAKKGFECPSSVYLQDASGRSMDVPLTDDLYASRPAGYDYRSAALDALRGRAGAEATRKTVLMEAEAAVSEFERWQIASAEDAAGLAERYNAVLGEIDAVLDPEERAALTDRAAAKYELLAGDVASAWADAGEKAREAEQAKTDADNAIAANESLLAAQQAAAEAEAETEAQNKRAVEWFIESLNGCEYYTESVERMISDAKEALAKCTAYGDYQSLQARLSSAISRARKLPSAPAQASAQAGTDAGGYDGAGSPAQGGTPSSGSGASAQSAPSSGDGTSSQEAPSAQDGAQASGAAQGAARTGE